MWNDRTDEYGGPLENRMRFTLECIDAIRKNIPAGMPVFVKFTPYHGVPGGRELDEGVQMAKILEAAGVDLLHVDVGCYEAWYKAITTVYSDQGHQLPIVKAIKDAVSVPVLGHGKLFDPALAEKVVEDGTMDCVGLAHQMLADPDWANKAKAGHFDDIRPCIGCNECLKAGFSGKHYYCAVNPQCYAERDYRLPAPLPGESRKVLVIGGGPAGMEAAIAAADRGMKVTLWEKSARLGGNLWAAGNPTFKHDVLRLIDYMRTQVLKKGVDVVFGKDPTVDEIVAFGADKVILAAGSHSLVPPIKGIECAKTSDGYLLGTEKPGKHVVVIGGGLVGCETAAYMAETAEDVTIVEMLPQILMTADDCLNNSQNLHAMIAERGIVCECGAKVTEVTPDSVTFERDGEEHVLPADTVIVAAGYRPNNALADELDGRVADLAVVGDAEHPRKIINAVHEAYHAIRVM